MIELDTAAVGPQIVVATNSGPGNFTVDTLNAAREEVDVVVDVVGPTTGRYFTSGDFQTVRIESLGDWTIETVPEPSQTSRGGPRVPTPAQATMSSGTPASQDC